MKENSISLPIQRWKNAISKFKYVLTYKNDLIDCVCVKVVNIIAGKEEIFRNLEEISQSKVIINNKEFKMLRMKVWQLKACQLYYDNIQKILLDSNGIEASTVGHISKGRMDTSFCDE